MTLDWLDRPLGPLRARAWLLVANMGANALALYGLSLIMRDAGGTHLFASGTLLTVLCIAIAAVPTSPPYTQADDADKWEKTS